MRVFNLIDVFGPLEYYRNFIILQIAPLCRQQTVFLWRFIQKVMDVSGQIFAP